MRIKQLALTLPILATLVLSSCYTDYGLDYDTNYDVVVTLYNNEYDFAPIQNYYLSDTVFNVGGGTQSSYSSTILSTTEANLNSLGWTRIASYSAALAAPNTIFVRASEFTTTTTQVDCGYGYYGWYYPDYYCDYSYSYTTGTVNISMADLSIPQTDGKTLVEWNATLNGLTNSSGGSVGGTPQTRITNGINQAFTQSPYLK